MYRFWEMICDRASWPSTPMLAGRSSIRQMQKGTQLFFPDGALIGEHDTPAVPNR
jgi:hypothetical protein